MGQPSHGNTIGLDVPQASGGTSDGLRLPNHSQNALKHGVSEARSAVSPRPSKTDGLSEGAAGSLGDSKFGDSDTEGSGAKSGSTIEVLSVEVLSVEDLSAIATQIATGSGIYFLFQDEVLVYIGKAKVHYTRLGSHLKNKAGKFNRVAFVPVAIEHLSALEEAYILRYRPTLNVVIPGIKSVRNILVGHIHRKTIVRWIRALDMEPAAIIRSWKASGGPLRFRGGSYNEMAVRSWLIQAVMTEGHTADQAVIIVDEQRP